MTHVSDDDLTLHHYRDPACRAGVPAHLDACAACAGRYRELAAALDLLPASKIPARDDRYGLEVWQRIRPELPAVKMGSGVIFRGHSAGLAAAAALVLMVAAAFLAWRALPGSGDQTASAVLAPAPVQTIDDSSRRVLLMSVADHLERSDRVLTDIMNAPAGMDISVEQGWAEDLLWTGRIYRQNALDVNEQSVAAVLDDLERTLLDIVHSPPQLNEAQLEAVRERVDSGALLFKVRVLRVDLTEVS